MTLRLASSTVLVALFSLAGTAVLAEEPPKKIDAKDIKVEIKDAELTLNGQKVTLPCDTESVEKVFGKPSRSVYLGNTALVWDDVGISAYQDRDSKKIISLSFALRESNAVQAPEKTFQGKVLVDGSNVTADTKVPELVGTKKGKPFVQSDIVEQLWSIKHDGGVKVSLSAANKKGDGIALVEYSFSKR